MKLQGTDRNIFSAVIRSEMDEAISCNGLQGSLNSLRNKLKKSNNRTQHSYCALSKGTVTKLQGPIIFEPLQLIWM